MKRQTLLRAGGMLLLLVTAVLSMASLPVKQYLTDFIAWVQGIGTWGAVILAAAYTPASLLFVPPALVLTLGAGFAFGFVRGMVLASAGSVVGATAAFLTGRTLTRGLIEARVARSPRFRAIDQAVAEQGFKIVMLTRLSPVLPFNVLNYAFGLTKVRFRDFVLASWLGMLPGTAMYVYIGTGLKSLADLATGNVENSIGQKVLFFVGLAATVVVTVFVTRIAQRALDKAIEQSSGSRGLEDACSSGSESPEPTATESAAR